MIDKELQNNKGIKVLREMGRISGKNGNAKMTLDEINTEIEKTRKEKKDNYAD